MTGYYEQKRADPRELLYSSVDFRPKVIAWLSRHPRVTFHFTPTSASWLNAVEGFFAALTKRRLKRGAFVGVVDLQAAINRYVAVTCMRAKSCPHLL